MADSYSKKEREKKRRKRQQEKAQRKEERKENGNKTPEFMYQDEYGNLSTTPPDPSRMKVKAEDIDISTPKQEKTGERSFVRSGSVKFFNTEKGYGFIVDDETKESFFVHANDLEKPIKDNDKVQFEVGKGPKGPVATSVKLI